MKKTPLTQAERNQKWREKRARMLAPLVVLTTRAVLIEHKGRVLVEHPLGHWNELGKEVEL